MKSHTKKKAYQRVMKQLAKQGLINDASGKMVDRSRQPDNSMVRDFSPQQSK